MHAGFGPSAALPPMPDQRPRCRRDPVVQQVLVSLVVLERPLPLVVQQGPSVLSVPPVRRVPVRPVLRCRPYRPFHLANLADPLDPPVLEVLVVLHSRRDLVKVLELESEWASEWASPSPRSST